MTRRVLALAVFGAAVLLVDSGDAQAFGKRSSGCNSGMSGCATSCAPSYTVTYVDQVIDVQQPVWKTRKVDSVVVEYKEVKEPFTYWVNTPVKTKQKVKVCQLVETKVPFDYVVNEMVQVKDKAKVCQVTWADRDVPYSYMEPVVTKTPTRRTVYDTVCVPTPVTCTVPVYVPTCGGCGGCYTGCTVCYTTVTRTVMKPTLVPRDIMVDVYSCTYVERKGVNKVKVPVETWVDQDVMVWKCVPKPMKGERIVCTPTWVDQDVDVWTCQPVEQKGERLVCRRFETPTKIDQPYCEWVPGKATVKVPVLVPCAPPVPTCGYVGYSAGYGGFSGGCCR